MVLFVVMCVTRTIQCCKNVQEYDVKANIQYSVIYVIYSLGSHMAYSSYDHS